VMSFYALFFSGHAKRTCISVCLLFGYLRFELLISDIRRPFLFFYEVLL
jgi:hypothetical protein